MLEDEAGLKSPFGLWYMLFLGDLRERHCMAFSTDFGVERMFMGYRRFDSSFVIVSLNSFAHASDATTPLNECRGEEASCVLVSKTSAVNEVWFKHQADRFRPRDDLTDESEASKTPVLI